MNRAPHSSCPVRTLPAPPSSLRLCVPFRLQSVWGRNMRRSATKLVDHSEAAIGAVRDAVAARRHRGAKASDAMSEVAAAAGTSTWRCKTLFHRMEGQPPVLAAEWNRLRFRLAAFLRAEADRQREMADALDARADALEHEQQELWENQGQWHGRYGNSRRRVA